MSRLPRGPAAAGSIRPPASGMTLSAGGRSFLDEAPTLPAFTQRIQPSARRATLTTSTFMPPEPDKSSPAPRSSTLAGGRMLEGTVSPSPSVSSDSQASLTLRSPSAQQKEGTISKIRGHTPTSEQAGGHDGRRSAASGRAGGTLQRTPRGQRIDLARGGGGSRDVTRPGSVAELRCGTAVFIPKQSLRGTLRYLGPIDGKQGTWAGVELDEQGAGKNNGTVAGKAYFSCPPDTGLFLAPSNVEPLMPPPQHGAGGSGSVPSISSVLSSTPGIGRRTVRLPAGPGSASGAPPSRKRVVSDARVPPAGLPPPPPHFGSASTVTSPLLNRRKTLSRGLPPTPGSGPNSNIGPDHANDQRPIRRPPTTVSRGTSRTRPISTTGSATSTRTESPSRSRPNSRTLAQAGADGTTPAQTPSKSSSRARILSEVKSPETQPARVALSRRRLGTLVSGPAQTTAATSRTPNTASGERTGSAADPVGRLRTRIDVLEAENRVLRLKNEQDKAHITASQMLARDLAANGTPSPPARGAFGLPNAPISPSVSLQQLSSARGALEQERKESRARIEQLEAQISELQAAGQDTGHDAPDPSKEEQTVVELREELTRTAEAHSKELDATASARSELAASLEQRAAEIEQLQAELDAKASEIDGLNGRLEERSLELSRATQRYRDLMDEQHASGPEESDPQPALEKQVGQLRHDLAESEEKLQRLAAAAATTTTTTADQSTAERDSARVLIARCRSHLSELITAMQPANDEASEDTLGDDSDGPDSKINPALFAKSRELASQLTERVGNAAERIESLDSELQAKDDLIAELRRELAALKEEQGAAPEAQARVEELESLNDRLVEERNQFIDEQASVNEYLEKLEAESHRLIEDIEQLTAENQKLTEELRAASLQNSAVSLDVGAVDSMLATEQSSSADVDGYADTAPEAAGDSSSDAGAAAVRRQLAELEKRKNAEIKSLEDELGSLETMVENMTFTESELNDKIASLTDEVDRLRHMHPAAGAGARARVAEPIIEEAAPDPEQSPCDVCGSADHSIDACPQVNAMPASLFKQDAPVDSSRPYCDNCESFGLHWTLDCPHDDEMF